MSKIMINGGVFSKGETELIENVKAIYKDNEITYKLNDVLVKITIFQNRLSITRKSKDMMLNFEFEKNKCLINKYLIKDLGLNVKVETKTKKLIINDNSIKLEYDLFMNDEFSSSFTFNLEWSDLK